METGDFVLYRSLRAHFQEPWCKENQLTAWMHWSAQCESALKPKFLLPSFLTLISQGVSRALVQQYGTSRRSMVTFARSQMLSRSFSVTPSTAACSLSSFHSSEVKSGWKDWLTLCFATFVGMWNHHLSQKGTCSRVHFTRVTLKQYFTHRCAWMTSKLAHECYTTVTNKTKCFHVPWGGAISSQ